MVAYASSNHACGNWRHLGEQVMRSGQSGHGRDDRFWRWFFRSGLKNDASQRRTSPGLRAIKPPHSPQSETLTSPGQVRRRNSGQFLQFKGTFFLCMWDKKNWDLFTERCQRATQSDTIVMFSSFDGAWLEHLVCTSKWSNLSSPRYRAKIDRY